MEHLTSNKLHDLNEKALMKNSWSMKIIVFWIDKEKRILNSNFR